MLFKSIDQHRACMPVEGIALVERTCVVSDTITRDTWIGKLIDEIEKDQPGVLHGMDLQVDHRVVDEDKIHPPRVELRVGIKNDERVDAAMHARVAYVAENILAHGSSCSFGGIPRGTIFCTLPRSPLDPALPGNHFSPFLEGTLSVDRFTIAGDPARQRRVTWKASPYPVFLARIDKDLALLKRDIIQHCK